ncbi:hypothetical protein PQX77_002730, partial [Marasmius sp. AFHP31]
LEQPEGNEPQFGYWNDFSYNSDGAGLQSDDLEDSFDDSPDPEYDEEDNHHLVSPNEVGCDNDLQDGLVRSMNEDNDSFYDSNIEPDHHSDSGASEHPDEQEAFSEDGVDPQLEDDNRVSDNGEVRNHFGDEESLFDDGNSDDFEFDDQASQRSDELEISPDDSTHLELEEPEGDVLFCESGNEYEEYSDDGASQCSDEWGVPPDSNSDQGYESARGNDEFYEDGADQYGYGNEENPDECFALVSQNFPRSLWPLQFSKHLHLNQLRKNGYLGKPLMHHSIDVTLLELISSHITLFVAFAVFETFVRSTISRFVQSLQLSRQLVSPIEGIDVISNYREHLLLPIEYVESDSEFGEEEIEVTYNAMDELFGIGPPPIPSNLHFTPSSFQEQPSDSVIRNLGHDGLIYPGVEGPGDEVIRQGSENNRTDGYNRGESQHQSYGRETNDYLALVPQVFPPLLCSLQSPISKLPDTRMFNFNMNNFFSGICQSSPSFRHPQNVHIKNVTKDRGSNELEGRIERRKNEGLKGGVKTHVPHRYGPHFFFAIPPNDQLSAPCIEHLVDDDGKVADSAQGVADVLVHLTYETEAWIPEYHHSPTNAAAAQINPNERNKENCDHLRRIQPTGLSDCLDQRRLVPRKTAKTTFVADQLDLPSMLLLLILSVFDFHGQIATSRVFKKGSPQPGYDCSPHSSPHSQPSSSSFCDLRPHNGLHSNILHPASTGVSKNDLPCSLRVFQPLCDYSLPPLSHSHVKPPLHLSLTRFGAASTLKTCALDVELTKWTISNAVAKQINQHGKSKETGVYIPRVQPTGLSICLDQHHPIPREATRTMFAAGQRDLPPTTLIPHPRHPHSFLVTPTSEQPERGSPRPTTPSIIKSPFPVYRRHFGIFDDKAVETTANGQYLEESKGDNGSSQINRHRRIKEAGVLIPCIQKSGVPARLDQRYPIPHAVTKNTLAARQHDLPAITLLTITHVLLVSPHAGLFPRLILNEAVITTTASQYGEWKEEVGRDQCLTLIPSFTSQQPPSSASPPLPTPHLPLCTTKTLIWVSSTVSFPGVWELPSLKLNPRMFDGSGLVIRIKTANQDDYQPPSTPENGINSPRVLRLAPSTSHVRQPLILFVHDLAGPFSQQGPHTALDEGAAMQTVSSQQRGQEGPTNYDASALSIEIHDIGLDEPRYQRSREEWRVNIVVLGFTTRSSSICRLSTFPTQPWFAQFGGLEMCDHEAIGLPDQSCPDTPTLSFNSIASTISAPSSSPIIRLHVDYSLHVSPTRLAHNQHKRNEENHGDLPHIRRVDIPNPSHQQSFQFVRHISTDLDLSCTSPKSSSPTDTVIVYKCQRSRYCIGTSNDSPTRFLHIRPILTAPTRSAPSVDNHTIPNPATHLHLRQTLQLGSLLSPGPTYNHSVVAITVMHVFRDLDLFNAIQRSFSPTNLAVAYNGQFDGNSGGNDIPFSFPGRTDHSSPRCLLPLSTKLNLTSFVVHLQYPSPSMLSLPSPTKSHNLLKPTIAADGFTTYSRRRFCELDIFSIALNWGTNKSTVRVLQDPSARQPPMRRLSNDFRLFGVVLSWNKLAATSELYRQPLTPPGCRTPAGLPVLASKPLDVQRQNLNTLEFPLKSFISQFLDFSSPRTPYTSTTVIGPLAFIALILIQPVRRRLRKSLTV